MDNIPRSIIYAVAAIGIIVLIALAASEYLDAAASLLPGREGTAG